MNKNEILQSGVLESYVLGVASLEEKTQVEEAITLFPDLKKVISEMELALEKAALENRIKAPEGIKSKILDKIPELEIPENQVRLPGNEATSSALNFSLLAACFVGGMILSAAAMWFGMMRPQGDVVSTMQKEIALLEEKCLQEGDFYAFINDQNTKPVVMRSVDGTNVYGAVGYWNDDTGKGLIRTNLPELESNLVYQIWADVEGEMISLGLLDYNSSKSEYVELQYLANAESLNITIEPAGGSSHPTVENLVVSGAI